LHYKSRELVLLLCTLLIAVHRPSGHVETDRYKLTVKLRGDTTVDRTWVEPTVERVATASEGDGYALYDPALYTVDRDGTVYVVDSEDWRIKTFTAEGEYVTTYGEGPGPNPGELTRVTSVGLKGDSLVYATEPRLRRVSYFAKDGSFLRTERHDDVTPYQIAWTDGATQYTFPPPRPGTPFMHRATPDRVRQINPPSRVEEPILLDGVLHSTGGKIVFIMRYLPILLTYSTNDLAGTAFPTPDYGEPPSTPQGGGPVSMMNGDPTISGDVLSIQVPADEPEHLTFDLYDVDSMTYLRSVRFSLELERDPRGLAGAHYAHGSGSLVTAQDSVLTFYRITMP
jgi:hypothetical protein